VRPDIYVPYTQRAQHRSDFVVRTHGDPALLVAAVRNEVLQLDKDLPVSNVTTMETLVDRALARSRFNGMVLGLLAGCALVLAVIGLYGVLSYTVAQRRGEIGIRMAVGASPWQMVRMVTLGGLRLTVLGTVVGVAAAWIVSRLYTSLLFQVSPLDPLTYAGAAVGILVVAALACAVPAMRAARVDPLQTLQSN
jgi:ABC-type antimicrobial peptide transport system permease subunit